MAVSDDRFLTSIDSGRRAFGMLLQALRATRALSAREFGVLAGVSRQYITKIELGNADLSREMVNSLIQKHPQVGVPAQKLWVMEGFRRLSVNEVHAEVVSYFGRTWDPIFGKELAREDRPGVDRRTAPFEVRIRPVDWDFFKALMKIIMQAFWDKEQFAKTNSEIRDELFKWIREQRREGVQSDDELEEWCLRLATQVSGPLRRATS